MAVEKTRPRKAINKKTKTKVVFDENARKEYLTGFKKRKDERRRLWKEKVDLQLKNEIKKIKEQTKAKLEKGMSKKNSSHQIVPEVAHLINSDLAETTVTDIGSASVSVTTLDNLKDVASPWHKDKLNKLSDEDNKEEQEEEEEEEEEEEMPGMSLKLTEVVPVKIGTKERKTINRIAVSQLHKSKAYKTKEKLKAKKQRNAAKWKKGKKISKKDRHSKKFKTK